VRAELGAYGHGLDEKPAIVALNKIDALTHEAIEEKAEILEAAAGAPVRRISAAAGAGLTPLLGELWTLARRVRKEAGRRADQTAWTPGNR
jgi:GTP-binding protein